MTNNISRRTIVKGAAWAVPVIAVAVSTPLAAASQVPVCDRYYLYRPQDYQGNGSMGPNNNVAQIEVTGTAVIVTYRRETDITDINVHKASGNVNKHIDGRVKPGTQIVIPLANCEDPTFIQVHGNNTHYYGGGVFR